MLPDALATNARCPHCQADVLTVLQIRPHAADVPAAVDAPAAA